HVIYFLIQADVYHAYQVVRKHKVPAKNIITFAYDDIATNPKNPFQGKVFHDYEHEDVYKGMVIDYRGKRRVDPLGRTPDIRSYRTAAHDRVQPSDFGLSVFVTTSAKENEQSFGIFCFDKDIDVCLANEYSYAWVLDSEY
ncbi:hypothetical protein T265_14946, partial [Opisthorchis viverrini]